jgi:uncharacterized protein
MNCPRCTDAVLSITYRTGIELDFCPKCRGVWMDRGELDKVLERSELERISESDSRKSARPRDEGEDSRDRRGSGRFSDESGRYERQPERRRSWLSEFFD